MVYKMNHLPLLINLRTMYMLILSQLLTNEDHILFVEIRQELYTNSL